MGFGRMVVVAASLALLVGCGSSGGSKLTASTGSTTTSSLAGPTSSDVATLTTSTTAPPASTATTRAATVAPTTTATHFPTTTTGPAKVVTAGDAENGTSIPLHRGDTLRVVLMTTDWTIGPASNAAVLALPGAPVVAPQSSRCFPPGVHCGTVTATFNAVGAGQASVVATRSYCGEALMCTPATSRYSLAVTVS